MAEAQRTQTGWSAHLALGFARRDGRTVLVDRHRSGPLAIQRPFYPRDDACHVYVLHPPGGVVGGDALSIDVHAGRGTHCLLTTPGAGRYYRSAGRTAVQSQRLSAAAGSTLEWLPQENIYFPGGEVSLVTRVDLEADARLLLWEIHCFGRPAVGERFDRGSVDVGLSVYRDGRALLAERQRHDARNAGRRALMAGRSVTAQLVASRADAVSLEECRQVDPGAGHIGVTRLEDLLIVRYLGDSTQEAREALERIWTIVREPVAGCAAVAPRIWRT